MKSLYIHIPFCQQKCYYCDFCSFVCSDDTQQKYVDKLIEELKFKGTKEQLKSVFIGGGTPSCLSENLIAKIMTAVSTYFEINETTEITIECNPNSLNEQKLKAYKCAGINRLSLGVQSLNDKILKTIGRIHTCKEFYQIAPLIQKYFSNFNFDIMIGLPNQTNFDVVDTIKKLMQFSPTHISMYSLILEENTKLFNQVQNNEIKLPLNDLAQKLLQPAFINVMALGAFIEKTSALKLESVIESMKEMSKTVSAKKAALLPNNIESLNFGAELIRNQAVVV